MKQPSLRSLPRIFVPGALPDAPFELPKEEIDKLRKVLRLSAGAQIAVLPNDGTVVRCVFQNHFADPIDVVQPQSEPKIALTIAQALPKGDKLDEIVRACTEIGVARFVLFASERTVVRWDEKKTADRVQRLATIAREAAEVSFRTKLPTFELAKNLADVLENHPKAIVLSEVEDEARVMPKVGDTATIVVGPEGGWDPKEVKLIGDRGVTLGPRVLRVDHAAPAAAAILLLSHA